MPKTSTSLLAAVLWLAAASASAHQPDVSSLTLVEQPLGRWMLQLNAPMTAFQHEVRITYGADSYASAEEFNQLLLEYLRAQIALRINNNDVTLGNGFVKLGHATTVVFELADFPEVVEEVWIKNHGFTNIRDSRSVFSIFKDGLDRDSFILNKENNFQFHLSLTE